MNNQELHNRSKAAENADVNTRRRFLKSTGVAAPVILTFASPSVFGVGCLSQQLSGNLSHPGDSCVIGHNPAYWKSPANESSWTAGGYTYKMSGNGALCSGYSGGTVFNDPSAFPSSSNNLPMRQILCNDDTTLESYLIAALLNAHFVSGYVLTPSQVLGLQNGSITPPGGNLYNFLATTW